ncbi:MAG: stage IV sporulation protein A [Lachnoclostridium sp.]|nr:stage IV sporulation protein A [Lachnoclostridium sp.]
MENKNVYSDITIRTGGEIYIGVVGPVRTGKSTFIKKFMTNMIIPGMEEGEAKEQAKDEMPQSGTGSLIMTTEPKFIPKEAAIVKIDDETKVKVRLIDCVGFIADGARGYMEDENERLVNTPWSSDKIPFSKAAEIGTKKVINEHSTIGIVVTSDGSFGDIKRDAFEEAEQKAVNELKKSGKPYIIVLNTVRPFNTETAGLAKKMTDTYNVRVMPVNLESMTVNDINNIMSEVLMEFPVDRIDYNVPTWINMLDTEHVIKKELIGILRKNLSGINTLRDIKNYEFKEESTYIRDYRVDNIDVRKGIVNVTLSFDENYYYSIISELTGLDIKDEYSLISKLKELSSKKSEIEFLTEAYESVKNTGYGVVNPKEGDINLVEPEVIRQGNKYGVRIKAVTPSIHMISANIETEIAPIVGTKEQAGDLLDYMIANSENGEEGIWNTNIFGKTVKELVDDGIEGKINKLTKESEQKLKEAIEKVINDSNGGLICLII